MSDDVKLGAERAGAQHASNILPDMLLRVQNLSVAFGEKFAVRDVSFDLPAGKTLALVGESGSGKSVTALSILRLLPRTARQRSGSIFFEGRPIPKEPSAALRGMRGGAIGMIFQEPMTSLNPLHSVGRQIAEAVLVHARNSHSRVVRKAAAARALELLDLVGIDNPRRRATSFAHQLSGGQRQRVMIAMALANSPRLLIADEPTTALDVSTQEKILLLLASIRREMNMSLLLISHNLHVVRSVADEICVMKDAQVVERGAAEDIFTRPRGAYTTMLLNAFPRGTPPPLAQDDAPPLLLARGVSVYFPSARGGLFKSSKENFCAVREVSLEVRRGETLGVVGESGCGKSTLALALLRLVTSRGGIWFDGADARAWRSSQLRAARKDMQIVFQDPYGSLSPRMSVRHIIGEGLGVYFKHLSRAEHEARIAAALDEVGLPADAADRYPHEFSGGQRQRIAIARALVLFPRFIVFDEPTSSLDASVQARIVELLRGLQRRRGISYLFISHDIALVRAVSHRVMVMKDGVVVERGDAQAVFDNPQHEYTRMLVASSSAGFSVGSSAGVAVDSTADAAVGSAAGFAAKD